VNYTGDELKNHAPSKLIEPVAEVLKWVKQLNDEKTE
jgi:flagellar biosynthesis protein FlhB